MKYRTGMRAGVGLLVAAFWAVYFFPTAPIPISSRIDWAITRLSCPIVFASFYFHFPLSVYWAVLANAGTYALIGVIVEALRRQTKRAN
jgi:hypothetical protein